MYSCGVRSPTTSIGITFSLACKSITMAAIYKDVFVCMPVHLRLQCYGPNVAIGLRGSEGMQSRGYTVRIRSRYQK